LEFPGTIGHTITTDINILVVGIPKFITHTSTTIDLKIAIFED
jgi:hypothetical protein